MPLRIRHAPSIRRSRPLNGRQCRSLVGQEIHRVGVNLGGEVKAESSHVLWLQAGAWFVDVRVDQKSGHIYSAFGGVVWWHKPYLQFEHLLNLYGGLTQQDVGTFKFTRLGCLERGILEAPSPSLPGVAVNMVFVEQWSMAKSSSTRVITFRKSGQVVGLEVQSDRYCVSIVGSRVRVFSRFGYRSWRVRYQNAPSSSCWLPTQKKLRPGWRIEELVGVGKKQTRMP